MPEVAALEGSVAQILNERELVINIGSTRGVRRGVKFAVLAPEPSEIFDPETGELLGVVDREKVRVQAREVHERFTICATYEKRVVRSGGSGFGAAAFRDLFEPPRTREVPITLGMDEESVPAPLSAEESYVKIGDRVKQVEE